MVRSKHLIFYAIIVLDHVCQARISTTISASVVNSDDKSTVTEFQYNTYQQIPPPVYSEFDQYKSLFIIKFYLIVVTQ